jgi:outer membrane lipoprotein-sorting protein
MALPTHRILRRRYIVPIAVVAATAAAVAVPQLASGVAHPTLAPRTASQLLASLDNSELPDFTGTVVETTRLGLPSLNDSGLAAAGTNGELTDVTGLLSGSHTAQIAYGGPDRQRIAVFLNNLSETDVVHNGADVWTYSSDDNTVSHSHHVEKAESKASPDGDLPGVAKVVDPQQSAKQALAAIDPTTAVSVDRTAEVAGRPAYQLVLTPRTSSSSIGSIRIAVDAKNSMPLRVQIWSRSGATSPAFEVAFTSLHLGMPSASTFSFKAPAGAATSSSPLLPGGELVRPSGSQKALQRDPGAGAGRVAAGSGSMHSVGKGWLRVLVGNVAPMSRTSNAAPSSAQLLQSSVSELASPVAGGRLLQTPMFSVLMTNDGRVLVGAVSGKYLEQLAAHGASR